MAAPKIYQWTDDGAPTLDATAGSLIAVLDACLINGYGDKPAAGWAKAFDGGQTAVYRASEGLRPYLRVTDDGSSAQGGKVAQVDGFLSMTAIDAGAGPFSSAALQGFFGKSDGQDTSGNSPRQWLLAADDKRLVLFSTRLDRINNGLIPMAFGELQAHHPTDTNACYLLAANSAAYAMNTSYANTQNPVTGDLPRESGTLGVFMPGSITALAPAQYAVEFLGQVSTGLKVVPVLSDFIWSSRVAVTNSNSNSSTTTGAGASAAPRGYLAGLLMPCHLLPFGSYPFWTDLGGGKRVIPRTGSDAYVLDTADWEVTA